MNWEELLSSLTIPALIEIIIGIVITYIVNKKIKEIEHSKEDNKQMKKGIQWEMRFDLTHLADKCKDKGYATDSEKREFEDGYQVYHALGKNGVMDEKRKIMLSLPNEPTKKHK